MSGRGLLAVTFDHHRGKIELVTRRQPLGADYPDLPTMLALIARTCVQDAIAPSQFRRIVFGEAGQVRAGRRLGTLQAYVQFHPAPHRPAGDRRRLTASAERRRWPLILPEAP